MLSSIKCEVCGKLIEARPSRISNTPPKYCSNECKAIGRSKQIIQTCITCGKEFIINAHDKFLIRFCSEKCINNYNLTELSKKHELHENICKNCGKHFAWITNIDRDFCSYKCRVQYTRHNNAPIKNCKNCGKPFNAYPITQQFCSHVCASSYTNTGRTKLWKKEQKEKPKFNYSIHGYYMDIHHYVRSTWEHNFARILQYNNIDYDYEPKWFKLSDGTKYLPDFYILQNNTFYEIKGVLRDNNIKKIELFKKEYPEINLKIIDSKKYYWLLHKCKSYNINFQFHYPVNDNEHYLNNITNFRHKNIQYEEWELEDKYYTNLNPELNINDCYSIQEACNISNIPKYKLKKLCINGKFEYCINNDIIYIPKRIINNIHNKNCFRKLPDTHLHHICKVCGKEFITYDPNKKFCSEECRNLNHKKIHIQNKYICNNCFQQYDDIIPLSNQELLCPKCYKKKYNTRFDRKIINYYWDINKEHINFNNEAENNFALILEYLGNSYTYQENIIIISKHACYKYHFYRKKNDTIYVIAYACTHKTISDIKRLKNNGLRIKIITAKQYFRIIKWFYKKIKFTIKDFNIIEEKRCPVCNKYFLAKPDNIYCSNNCKEKAKSQRASIQRTYRK